MPSQGGVGWAEIGHLYDPANDPVTACFWRVDAANHRIGPADHCKRSCSLPRSARSWHPDDKRRRRMSLTGDTDPSESRGMERGSASAIPARVTFTRRELDRILNLYGRMVAAGEWRDYAIDFLKDKAVFSVFRRSAEVPLYRIEKNPKLARKQGAYSVITATGLILRRGHELDRVLLAIDRKLQVV
jgi:Protein of unknown function (DUF2794)